MRRVVLVCALGCGACVATTDAGAPPPRLADRPEEVYADAEVATSDPESGVVTVQEPRCEPSDGPTYRLPAWVLAGRSEPHPTPTLAALETEIAETEAGLAELAPTDPTRPTVLERLAGAYIDAAEDDPERSQRGIQLLATLIQDHPDAPDMDRILFRLAWQLGVIDQHDRARQVYHRLVQHHPQSAFIPLAYVCFGEHYFHEGDYRAAAQFYDRARQLAITGLVAAYAAYKEAWSFRQMGQPGPASDAYRTSESLASRAPGGDALTAAIPAEGCTG